jgi:hypothetical protein
MSDELRFHIEQYTDELVRSGLSPEKAARRARIDSAAPSILKLIAGKPLACTSLTSFTGS